MLTKKSKPLLLICTLLLNFSCYQNLNDPPPFESLIFQDEDFLNINELLEIRDNILDQQFDFENGKVNFENFEQDVKNSLKPLVENGKNLHNKIMNNLILSGEGNKLSAKEKKEIEELSDQQLAELSFAINYTNHAISIDPRIRACLSSALGIVGIYDLVKNTGSLGSVQSTMKALRLIGRRTLGWIGVGIMVLDFTDCYYAL